MNRRSFFGALAGLPLVGRMFAEDADDLAAVRKALAERPIIPYATVRNDCFTSNYPKSAKEIPIEIRHHNGQINRGTMTIFSY